MGCILCRSGSAWALASPAKEHPVVTTIPASQRTREGLTALIEGGVFRQRRQRARLLRAWRATGPGISERIPYRPETLAASNCCERMFLIATVKRISRIDQSALTPFALALPICGRGYARRPTHRVFAGSAPAIVNQNVEPEPRHRKAASCANPAAAAREHAITLIQSVDPIPRRICYKLP